MTIITKRTALLGMITTTAFATAPVSGIAASQLNWSARRGDQNDFFRAPVLVSGETESILIDGSFNYGGGAAVVEAIKASGTTLTTIFVSINDPDYYFSLKPIVEAYPQARVIAAPETISKLKAKVQSKLETWGPVLGEYGPQTLDDIIIPEPFEGDTLSLEGKKIEIVASDTMADRRYLYVPSLDAVFGGVYAFDGLHVWTADTPNRQDRQNWIAELDALIAKAPSVVVAGHAASGVNNGVESLKFTKAYLLTFENEVEKAKDSSELIVAMKGHYPELGLLSALEIGAKVVMGEMAW